MPKTGEDVVYIFVDSDNESTSGFQVAGVGAEHLVEVRGRHGEIQSRTLLSFTGLSRYDWMWREVNATPRAECDFSQMEVGLSMSDLGITGNFSVVFVTTDWRNSTMDVSDNIITDETVRDGRGTRAPPNGGWPGLWTSLGTDPDDAGIEDNDDILEIFAYDNRDNLFMRMDIQALTIEGKDTYDFYFNASASGNVWYRVRLYRNFPVADWTFDLDYTVSATTPNDLSIWTNEETHTVGTDFFDGTSIGFNFNNANSEGIANSIFFWVDKDSLNQGYDKIEAGNTTDMFADTHDGGSGQNKQVDRAPDDTGDPDPTYSYTAIPEFTYIIIPIISIIIPGMIISRRKRRKGD
jgi:hypothetical protein